MLCEKCGREVKAGERFCNSCGAPVYDATQSGAAAAAPGLDGMSVAYIVGAVLNLLLIPLWFSKFLNVGIEIAGYSSGTSVTMHQMSQNGGMGWFSYVMAVLFIASAAAIGINAKKGAAATPGKLMILPIVVDAITFLNAVGTYVSVKQQIISQYSQSFFSDLDYGLAFGGTMSILLSAALVVLCVIAMVRGKKH